jgi:hypothetical protein
LGQTLEQLYLRLNDLALSRQVGFKQLLLPEF